MAQQFLADAQDLAAAVAIVTTAETTGPQTNPLPLPYQNGKFRIAASLLLTLAAGVTSVTIRVRRNPAAENLVVNTPVAIAVTASTNVSLQVMCVDQVPDGRSCSYAVTVVCAGAGANGTIAAGSHAEAVAMSG